MNRAEVNTVVRRLAALLMLSTAPFVAIERANATCSPTTPTVFDCTGPTTDQNPPNGFGTGTETGITINVQTGASVTSTTASGTAAGIFVSDGTVNNLGTITGQQVGVVLAAGGTVVNSGAITGTNIAGIVTSVNTLTVTNSGIITSVTDGIFAPLLNLTNDGGSIQATGANGKGVAAISDATVTNKVNGISGSIGKIFGTLFAINADGGPGNPLANVTVANGNQSTAGGVISSNGTAIHATGTATVSNFGDGTTTGIISGNAFGIDAGNVTVANGNASTAGGVISSVANGTAIHATGTATVGNFGDGTTTGIISGNAFGIDAGAVTVNANTGKIEATGASGRAINATNDATINNAGTIQANGAFGIAVESLGTATVTNSGTIQANGGFGLAIGVRNAVTVDNSGTIQATGLFSGGVAIETDVGGNATIRNAATGTIAADNANGIAISATTADVTNAGKIQALGTGGTAIHATGTATVSNFGDGIVTGVIAGGAFGIDAGTVNVTANTGLIDAIAAGGIAINAHNDATVTNSGTIQANVSTGRAINSEIGSINVTNTSTGTIQANGPNSVVIEGGQGAFTVNNAGAIQTNGTQSRALQGNQSATNVTNFGTVQATGASGIAITSNNDVIVSNTGNGTTTGIIFGDAYGIRSDAGTVNVTGNSGLIEAKGANGIISAAVFATSGDVAVTGNIGTIRANGTGPSNAINGENVTVTGNAGIIEATSAGNAAIFATLAKVENLTGGTITGGGFGIQAGTLDVTNALGATIRGGTIGITGSGSVMTAGSITGGTNSVAFLGGAGTTNTLTLQTGAVLNGDAAGSTGGATNNLVLQGSGATTSNFVSFNNLNVQASGTWIWNSTTSAFGQTTVESGTLAVDGVLFSPVSVSSGAVLGGRGTINGVVSVAGTLAPGAAVPFSTLTVNGNVNFANASIYRVNVGTANQNDKLQLNASGTASLGNATVNVLAQSGFALATPYNILNASGGLNNTRFGSVTSNLAFLTPTLTYDLNNVFLTLDAINGGGGGGFGLAGAAQTRNQRAVAGALDASPSNNPLVLAVLTQTSAEGARQAFDALSGEVFGSVHNAQAEEANFARSGMLGRLRQMSYASAPGELSILGFAGPELAYAGDNANAAYAADVLKSAVPGKAPSRAPGPSRDLTFWTMGLGGWGHTDSDGNAASLKSRFGGFLSGADARFGDTWRAGLVAGYLRSDLNVDARASSAGIDSVQIGAYAGGKLGALNVRGGASISFDSIDTSRGIFFPGFTDQTSASFHGNVGQVFGEVGYGAALGNVAIEPVAGLAYVHVHDNSFLESGGAAALSGASAAENIGYSWLGIRAATLVPLANGTALVPRGSLQWQYAFGNVIPAAGLAFQGTGAAFSVAGVPIARNTALVEGGVDWRFSPHARLGASYQGELAAHAESHAFKGAFSWNF